MEFKRRPDAELIEIAPKLWRFGVPFPNNPLELTYVYLVETPNETWLIDAGWDSDVGWDVLTRTLTTAGHELRDVNGVVLTHFHPDHAGLGRRILETTSISVALHDDDVAVINATHSHDGDEIVDRMERFALRAGAPHVEESERSVLAVGTQGQRILPVASNTMNDGRVIDETLRIIHTPGHTPGHCIVVVEDRKVVILGDHLLPRITPNISSYDTGEGNPLGDYLRSLFALIPFANAGYQFHPAHEWEVLHPHERIFDVIAHHKARSKETYLAVLSHPESTCWEIASKLTWSRSWEEIARVGMRRAAVGETMAHLQLLNHLGAIVTEERQPERWKADVQPLRYQDIEQHFWLQWVDPATRPKVL